MPAKIALSAVRALGFDFAAAVAGYKQQLAEFGARPSDWDPIPPPTPQHPLVALAASVESYEIHDDTPPPPAPPPKPSLEDRKQAIAAIVQRLGQSAVNRILPPLKRPLLDMDLQEARRIKDEDRTQTHRDIINDRKGIDERIQQVQRQVAETLAKIADMDEAALDEFAAEVDG